MSVSAKQPTVSMSAVAAAGLASATAALLTSRFGVAGTIIGAALTTMIITGGSAILKAYLESVSGRVRKVPGKVRERSYRARGPEDMNGPNLPDRPDLRNNFMGRLRAALNWFSNLSTLRKRTVIGAALVPAVIAFLIGMGAVTGVELASGKSLSCGVWNKCPASSDGTNGGTRPSILGAGAKTDSTDATQDQQQVVDPAQEQQVPSDSGVQPVQPANPQEDVAPAPEEDPVAPAPEEDPAAQEPPPEDPVVEEAPPPEEQAPSEPPASEDPADPSGGSAQDPASQP